MRATLALSKFIISLAAFVGGGMAIAQDALPETPPELRDFRLDPERAAPEPQPQPTPQPAPLTPSPAVSTVPTRATERLRPQPERRDAEPAAPATPADSSIPKPLPEVDEPVAAAEPAKQVAREPLSTERARTSPVPFGQIGAGLALAAIMLLGVFWIRRRRIASGRPVQPFTKPDLVSTPLLPPVHPASVPEQLSKKPNVTLDFIPEKATISLATLTIKGQLRLANTGDSPATGMELRAGLISAGQQQESIIRAFHDSILDINPEALGEAKPGETIAMSMELSVPLTEMQSFAIGDQRLMVPILVANLTYHGSDEPTSAITQIACMIGREAKPPGPKMGALRLDLGPRSFAPLGQRPVYA